MHLPPQVNDYYRATGEAVARWWFLTKDRTALVAVTPDGRHDVWQLGNGGWHTTQVSRF